MLTWSCNALESTNYINQLKDLHWIWGGSVIVKQVQPMGAKHQHWQQKPKNVLLTCQMNATGSKCSKLRPCLDGQRQVYIQGKVEPKVSEIMLYEQCSNTNLNYYPRCSYHRYKPYATSMTWSKPMNSDLDLDVVLSHCSIAIQTDTVDGKSSISVWTVWDQLLGLKDALLIQQQCVQSLFPLLIGQRTWQCRCESWDSGPGRPSNNVPLLMVWLTAVKAIVCN